MEHKSFDGMSCPIALALNQVGEWWSILILRDATHGLTRFEQFQKSLGISPNSLSRRLGALVEAGLLERRRYNDRPPRDEYVLTEAGHAFRPVLIALYAWGNQYFPPAAPNVRLVDSESGLDVEPLLIDRSTGRPLDDEHSVFLPGPTADDRLRAVLEQRRRPMA
ncbi:helix-turn-helix domain-containing protein [Nocardia sp. NRRL WC-3656]|uniref:winged helix-turn-helix transcriptional regulator n=1 Tax=Nocardia sp. NRRL WC-3656 TaxID=1463824 RepID=UPI00055A4EB1|nr:helix-turn-helix domain-containing protein [Nocardia sp. NRRL WC-3656]